MTVTGDEPLRSAFKTDEEYRKALATWEKRAAAAALHPCACGCGAEIGVKQTYVRGHDAKHYSVIKLELALLWGFTFAESRADQFTVGTKKWNDAQDVDRRRRQRLMPPAIAKALREVPAGRRPQLETFIAKSGFAEYAKKA